jgi:DNA-directed RNA polymerase subunit RPC12/RpoP
MIHEGRAVRYQQILTIATSLCILTYSKVIQLRMIEVYQCPNCNSKIVFPRYGEIKRIADSRIGR